MVPTIQDVLLVRKDVGIFTRKMILVIVIWNAESVAIAVKITKSFVNLFMIRIVTYLVPTIQHVFLVRKDVGKLTRKMILVIAIWNADSVAIAAMITKIFVKTPAMILVKGDVGKVMIQMLLANVIPCVEGIVIVVLI